MPKPFLVNEKVAPETTPDRVRVFWRTLRERFAVRAAVPARLRLWVPVKVILPPRVSGLAPVVMAAPVVLSIVPPLSVQEAVAAPRAAALLRLSVPAVRTLDVPVNVFTPESVRRFVVLTVSEPVPERIPEMVPKLPAPICVTGRLAAPLAASVPPARLKVFGAVLAPRSSEPSLMVTAPVPRAWLVPAVTAPPLMVVPPEKSVKPFRARAPTLFLVRLAVPVSLAERVTLERRLSTTMLPDTEPDPEVLSFKVPPVKVRVLATALPAISSVPAAEELPLIVAPAVPRPALLARRTRPEAMATPPEFVLAPPRTVIPGPFRVKTSLPLIIPLTVKAL